MTRFVNDEQAEWDRYRALSAEAKAAEWRAFFAAHPEQVSDWRATARTIARRGLPTPEWVPCLPPARHDQAAAASRPLACPVAR